MRDLKERDEIDGLIEGVLSDPTRADAAKAILRSRLAGVNRSNRATDTYGTSQRNIADDADDMWDNVPV